MSQTTFRTRALTADTLHAAESHRLLAWALAHGADEFTLDVRAIGGIEAPLADAFEDTLGAWETTPARRRVPYRWTAPDCTREVRLWTLTAESLALLEPFFPGGLFTQAVHERGWLEDPVFYRRGEFLLGVITHEREGLIRVAAAEERELLEMGIPLGDVAPPAS